MGLRLKMKGNFQQLFAPFTVPKSEILRHPMISHCLNFIFKLAWKMTLTYI